MDFQLTPEDAAFREEVRSWLQAHREQIDHTREVDWEAGGDPFERYRAWERTLFEAGLAAIAWPTEYGGPGATPMAHALFTHEYVKAQAADPLNRLRLGLP